MTKLWMGFEHINGFYTGLPVGVYVSAQTQRGRVQEKDKPFGDGPIILEARLNLNMNQIELLDHFKRFARETANLRASWGVGLWGLAPPEYYLKKEPNGIVTYQYGAGRVLAEYKPGEVSQRVLGKCRRSEREYYGVEEQLQPVFEDFVKKLGSVAVRR